MKKNTRSILLCALFALPCTTIAAYESGCECGAGAQPRPLPPTNCLALLKEAVAENEWEWGETHCKTVAHKIIALFKHEDIVQKLTTSRSDLHTFMNTPMGRTLLSQSQQPEHLVFLYQCMWQRTCICR